MSAHDDDGIDIDTGKPIRLAGVWVPCDAVAHTETLVLAKALKVPPLEALGYRTALDAWCVNQAPDGVLADAELAVMVACVGSRLKPSDVLAAFVVAKLLEPIGGAAYKRTHWEKQARKIADARYDITRKRKKDASKSAGNPAGNPAGKVPRHPALVDADVDVDGLSPPSLLSDKSDVSMKNGHDQKQPGKGKSKDGPLTRQEQIAKDDIKNYYTSNAGNLATFDEVEGNPTAVRHLIMNSSVAQSMRFPPSGRDDCQRSNGGDVSSEARLWTRGWLSTTREPVSSPTLPIGRSASSTPARAHATSGRTHDDVDHFTHYPKGNRMELTDDVMELVVAVAKHAEGLGFVFGQSPEGDHHRSEFHWKVAEHVRLAFALRKRSPVAAQLPLTPSIECARRQRHRIGRTRESATDARNRRRIRARSRSFPNREDCQTHPRRDAALPGAQDACRQRRESSRESGRLALDASGPDAVAVWAFRLRRRAGSPRRRWRDSPVRIPRTGLVRPWGETGDDPRDSEIEASGGHPMRTGAEFPSTAVNDGALPDLVQKIVIKRAAKALNFALQCGTVDEAEKTLCRLRFEMDSDGRIKNTDSLEFRIGWQGEPGALIRSLFVSRAIECHPQGGVQVLVGFEATS